MWARLIVGLGALAVVSGVLPVGAAGAGSTTRIVLDAAKSTTTCSDAPASGSKTLGVAFEGRTRTVIVHVPTGYSGSTAVPLVLNLHGSGSTAAQQEALSGMDAEADLDGFIVAYPQAAIRSGPGFDWNLPGIPLGFGATTPRNPPDDVAFLTQLVGLLATRYCVNAARVYATGFSGGARMTSLLGCDDSNIFAAIAPVSGLRFPTPCPAVRAMPVISFHGTADPVDPYRGHGQPYWTYSVPTAARDWAAQDGCRTRPRIIPEAAHATLANFAGCANDADVALITIDGEGHEWPGGPLLPSRITRVLGPQSSAVNANAIIWSFFEAHKL